MKNSDKVTEIVQQLGVQARKASRALMGVSTDQKNQALHAMANALEKHTPEIKKQNALDVADGKEKGLSSAMVDRLVLNDERMSAMIQGLRDIAELPDPVGNIRSSWKKENGLILEKRSVPIGVIGMIYESRPNVTADAAALCLKASNAIILRGGSEALRSNQAIADALQEGGREAGLPEHVIQLIPISDRDAVTALITMDQYVDVIIPRGGEGLIRAVAENATVPVLKHYKGVCHVYVDRVADAQKAWSIVENAKCQRPGVCNAAETMLVHSEIAASWLPEMADILESRGVELRGDDRAREWVPSMKPATEEDWYTEYLDMILSVKIVDDIYEAIDHIHHYGSGHSDAIVTEVDENKAIFGRMVDSAAVYINASTRFTDGAEFGMGAEIGISTDRLHARGPVALEELTTYKYVVTGDGQIK
ncbi:glutamate-5-semialdehyde dehydrogenase [Balneolaceae bacterium ANBcel3]|nr:glutamate-5-semialdehyde dehydrogenase [Balneolaceae bacterium ANBcel3]